MTRLHLRAIGTPTDIRAVLDTLKTGWLVDHVSVPCQIRINPHHVRVYITATRDRRTEP